MPTIQANNLTFYYELHGPAGAPVLVLNNGIIMNAVASWALQTPALSRHYRTPWERPAEFNTIVLGFLAKQP